jgi:hypothetical protein
LPVSNGLKRSRRERRCLARYDNVTETIAGKSTWQGEQGGTNKENNCHVRPGRRCPRAGRAVGNSQKPIFAPPSEALLLRKAKTPFRRGRVNCRTKSRRRQKFFAPFF